MRRSWASVTVGVAGRWSSASLSYWLVRFDQRARRRQRGLHRLGAVPRRSGLFEKSRVQTAGISVGQIEKRELDEDTARRKITIRMQPDDQALRERGRLQEVGVAAGRVLPGDRSGHAESTMVNGRASVQMRLLKDGDQITNVIEPMAIGDIDGAASGR